MTTLASDAFNRSNSTTTLGTADVGGPWVAGAGTWGIQTNRAYCPTPVASGIAFAHLPLGASDCVLEVTVTTMPASGNAGIIVRAGLSGGLTVRASQMYNGVSTVGPAFSATFVSGDRMRVLLSGPSITVFRQAGAAGAWNQVMSTSTPLHQTNTNHGLFIFDTAAGTARFDNFSAESLSYSADTKVEIAFDSGYTTPVGSRTWTDVSAYVELDSGITINHGRQDEFGVAEPNRLVLTLDNSDGRFTPEKTSGAYYPNVKIGRPIRVTTTWAGTEYVRFVGYVDEWPVAWNGASSYAEAQVTASSRIARLGFDSELRSTITEEYLSAEGDPPLAYWPMQEGSGATAAADLMGGPSLTIQGWGDTPEFGTGMGLLGDPSATGAHFKESGTQWLRTTLASPLSVASPNVVSIEMFFAGQSHNSVYLVLKAAEPSLAKLELIATDDVVGVIYDDGTNFATVAWPVDLSFSHHIAGSVELSGGGAATMTLWVDGTQVNSTSTPGMTSPAPFASLQLDYDDNTLVNRSTLAHVAINADMTRVAERAAAGITGFDTDTAEDRILRYAGYAGIDPAEVDADAGLSLIGPLDTSGGGVLDAMRKVEATENGVLFDSRDNTLTFHGRERRYHAASAFTIDAAAQQVESDLLPKLDRSTLANDVTASTSADGSSARAIDQTSIDEYGYARTSLDIAGNQDAGYQAALWRVLNYSQPLPRIDSLGVNLMPLATALRASLLDADVGTRFTLSGLPTQAPATSVDFFIEGYVETIGLATYELAFNVSPVNDTLNNNVWILGDATYGQYEDNILAY